MRLAGVRPGGVVEVDKKGRRFYALVRAKDVNALLLAPADARTNFYTASAREVVGHWRKAAANGR